ncbi:Serine protease nudel like protein [Argiope bruennichi]|uniref:Serine protease nudel like protein n=1 Tax=Argiope bruennichi TaxID=94029 RepID=A0A8T0FE94_ARGBR|nr:Serine protease nudel like protein [Argiope bruennichi]
MPFQHRCRPIRFSWRYIGLTLVMSSLFVGFVFLLFYFISSKSQPDSLDNSKAEPVWRGGTNGTNAIFPFEKDLWMNLSSIADCPKGYFACNSSRKCLKLDKRCDGTVDCPSTEDELNCVCAFRIPSSKFCDMYPDCFDETDESFCSYCPKGSFNCGDGRCINKTKVCDGTVDCNNYMDENFCFRLSPNGDVHESHEPDPISTSNVETRRNGFLLRNQNGIWYPMCANPYDSMQDALASFACVSITANPSASSTHQFRRFGFLPLQGSENYIYHYQGKFVLWRGCLTAGGIFIACNDAKCGLNPHHLLPKRPVARIVGGENSQPGNWPWHAAVYKNGTYSCGATLINNRWLLSAAHCFLDHRHTYYEVTLGMLRRKSFTPHQKTYRIDKVVPHPKFNIVTLEYDIVMLRTAEEVGFDFWVRPICLPNPRWAETSGSFCTAIGWGDIGESMQDSDGLQEVHVPLTKTCKRNQDRWLCAGLKEGGRDACQGDSGGPLMCLFGDGFSWYIAGIISGGNGCGRPQTPGMYTRVVYFLDWINQIMRFRNSDVPPLPLCPGLRCAVLGGGNCLDPKRVCNKHVDCYDALDEVNCTRTKS